MSYSVVNSVLASVPETTGFVDKLFECLTTKNYLGNPTMKEPAKEEVKPAVVKAEVPEVRVTHKD